MADRVHKGRGFPWTAEQVAFLKAHALWQDGALVAPISALGPPRTISGIKGQRKDLGLPRPPAGPSGGDYFLSVPKPEETWPPMKGNHRRRDRLFQEALWTAQLDLVRSGIGG